MNTYCDDTIHFGCSTSQCDFEAEFDTKVVTGGGNLVSPDITTIRVLDQSEYDAIEQKDPKTLYFIKG